MFQYKHMAAILACQFIPQKQNSNFMQTTQFSSLSAGHVTENYLLNKLAKKTRLLLWNSRFVIYGGISRFLASSNTAGKIVHSPVLGVISLHRFKVALTMAA